MAGMKIRAGDTVEVITGKDAGRRGRVLEAIPAEGRVIVEGRNIAKKHSRPRPVRGSRGAQMTPGGVIDLEHLAAAPDVLAGQHLDEVAAADLQLLSGLGCGAGHHSTSGASETIFMKLRSRSSRATGPKMRVPRGLRAASMITAALSSKAM